MCWSLSVLPSATCTPLCTLTHLWPQSFLPVKGARDRESGIRRNMPRRCCPASHPAHPPFQNHLDHREWINHIRGSEERWEVDSTVTAGVALARLIPLGRGKRGTPSRLRGRERKKHFPRNEFTCMVTQRSWPRWCLLEETITLGTKFFFFFFMLGTTSLSAREQNQWQTVASPRIPFYATVKQPCAISLPNSEKMGRGAVRRIKLTSSAIVSAPEFNLNVNLCRQNVNRMLSIKIYPAG